MLKSVSVWALKDSESRPADWIFAGAREHGFEGIELAVGLRGLLKPEATEKDCTALLHMAAEEGIRISSLASGLGWQFPLTHDDPEVRRRGVAMIRKSIHIARWLQVKALLVVPGMLAPIGTDSQAHVPYDVAYDRMDAGLIQLVSVAEEAGIVLGIENVWNRLLLSPLEMRDFIDHFGSDALGSYLDVGNAIAFGYAEDWVRILGPRICCVHFKDFKRSVGTLEGFCDLLEGDVNYPAVMKALREVEYDGPCVAEFFDLGGPALDKLSAAMDAIFAM